MSLKRLFVLVISCLALSLSAMAYPFPQHNGGWEGRRGRPPVAMPEPSSMAMAGMGLVGLIGAIRRKARG